MKRMRNVLLGAVVGLASWLTSRSPQAQADAGGRELRTHRSVTFAFDAQGAMAEVMPLFGADRERVWAEGWDPRFVYPSPAEDRPGMVFVVAHGHTEATWVNVQFDLEHGAVQYVYVVPAAMATLITIRATPRGATTHVEVTYDRTALDPAANAHVEQLAAADRAAGPSWARQINAYLAKARMPPQGTASPGAH